MNSELTAIILSLNEAAHITECIESIQWSDRVFVLDAFSDDNTVAIARAAGAEVCQATFRDFAHQRNTALEQIKTDWVFFVDADERGTPALGEEILEVIGSRKETGWYVPRHNYIFGRLTRGAGWYPDYQLRLFQHGRVRYERPVHELAVVDGDTGRLKNPLIHYNYRDQAQFHLKQRAYAEYDARVLKEAGIRPAAHTYLTQPIRHWWWRFVTLNGYQDGFHGLRLSSFMAYYEWLKYRELASLWREN